MDSPKGLLFVADRVTGICSSCRGEVIEFSVPNPVWNAVVRRNGPEHENEYLCIWCYANLATVYLEEECPGK